MAYDPFAQYGGGLQQAQQWSNQQIARLPPLPAPPGSPPVQTTGGGPVQRLVGGLGTIIGNMRNRRGARQLMRQGINPFTGQPGNVLQPQPGGPPVPPPMGRPGQAPGAPPAMDPQMMAFLQALMQTGQLYGSGGPGRTSKRGLT